MPRLRSADTGIEIQVHVRESSWSHGHLVDLTPGEERGRCIRPDRVSPGGEGNQEMTSRIAVEARDDTIALAHLKAGAEWCSTGLFEATDGLGGAAVRGSFKTGRS